MGIVALIIILMFFSYMAGHCKGYTQGVEDHSIR